MALQLEDTALRGYLEASIRTAWSPVRIYPDPPDTVDDSTALPRVFVVLHDLQPLRTGGTAGLGEWSITHRYTITGQFAEPTSGTIAAARQTKLNALLALLTAANTYNGYRYTITNIPADPGEMTAAEDVYHAVIEIEIEAVQSL